MDDSKTSASSGTLHDEQHRAFEKETADDARIRLTGDAGKVILVLVGLPARGKSLICHKLLHFLWWRGYVTKSFKVGDYRREAGAAGAQPESSGQAGYSGASFFDTTKGFAMATREAVTQEAFDELLAWLKGDGAQIAIFDASNVTIQRRAKLWEKASKAKFGVVYIETICTDEKVIEEGMMWKVKNSKDFANLDVETAMQDLRTRINHYEKVYQSVREEEG